MFWGDLDIGRKFTVVLKEKEKRVSWEIKKVRLWSSYWCVCVCVCAHMLAEQGFKYHSTMFDLILDRIGSHGWDRRTKPEPKWCAESDYSHRSEFGLWCRHQGIIGDLWAEKWHGSLNSFLIKCKRNSSVSKMYEFGCEML